MDGDVVAGAGGEPRRRPVRRPRYCPGRGTKPSTGRSGMRVGILLSSTLTTPPMAPPPYSGVDGAAQHFHFARQHGFHGGGVVRRNRRHIEQLRAVGQHADTRRGLAADHRPAGAAAVGVGVHAGQAIQGIAQGGFALLEQQLVFKQVERGRRQIGVAARRQGGHFHGVQPAVGVGGRGLGGRRRGPDHGGHGGGRHGGVKRFMLSPEYNHGPPHGAVCHGWAL